MAVLIALGVPSRLVEGRNAARDVHAYTRAFMRHMFWLLQLR